MQEPRSAGAMGAEFPYTLQTMCYIEVSTDGNVRWGTDKDTLDHRRLMHHQGGKLVVRRMPIPGLHTVIIPYGRSSPTKDLTSYFRSMFPKARVTIAEIEDGELGVSYEGPVRRLNAGADTYLPPSTIPHLAKRLDRAITRLNQITGNTSTPLTIEALQDHNLLED